MPETTATPFDLKAARAYLATLTIPTERVKFLKTLTLKNQADMMAADLVDGLNTGAPLAACISNTIERTRR